MKGADKASDKATRGTVLIVEDKESLRELLVRVVGARHRVLAAADGDTAIAMLAAAAVPAGETGGIDVVLTDIKMPGRDGVSVLREVRARWPHVEVILMTAYASVQSAVDAMREGAFDYLPKPFEPDDALLKIDRAVEMKRLRERAAMLQDTVDGRVRFDRLVGKSPAMQRALTLLKKAAALDLTILLLGETGTGKELAARAVHAASTRSAAPFVPVNCGALPSELMESELFGHVKGSFTGAVSDKRGLFEEAGEGTVFLDEIGDLPLSLQVKLNRALQERTFRRVGDARELPLRARVLAATHVDLQQRVADGRFREDLYYRLKVFPVDLPPLRARAEDLEELALTLFHEARTRLGRSDVTRLAPSTLRAIGAYRWPGNVRELQHAMERAVAVADGAEIVPEDLPVEVVHGATRAAEEMNAVDVAHLPYRDAIALLHDRATRGYLEALLASEGGNVSRAAEKAGLARESLHRLMRKHGVDADAHRDG